MEQYDMICFHAPCVTENKQLFGSCDSESQFHFSENHDTFPIHKGSSFFRNLKIPEVNLPLT